MATWYIQWQTEVEADDPLSAVKIARTRQVWPQDEELRFTVSEVGPDLTDTPVYEVDLGDDSVAQML